NLSSVGQIFKNTQNSLKMPKMIMGSYFKVNYSVFGGFCSLNNFKKKKNALPTRFSRSFARYTMFFFGLAQDL
ncbi:hypothetical protein, partial [Acinetobacter baumannii]|uniref:hypothetical protein n=1 Tax=Acinetobacter baumannii TaxID=470 RepID=UPI001C07507C